MEARDWLHSQAWLRPWNENGDEPLASIPSPLDLQWLFSGNASFHLDLRQQYGTTVDRTAEVKAVPSPASTLRFLDSDAHSQLVSKNCIPEFLNVNYHPWSLPSKNLLVTSHHGRTLKTVGILSYRPKTDQPTTQRIKKSIK